MIPTKIPILIEDDYNVSASVLVSNDIEKNLIASLIREYAEQCSITKKKSDVGACIGYIKTKVSFEINCVYV